MAEEWRNIEGFNGFYQVSNTGKIRSRGSKNGSRDGKWHIRSLSLNHDGYQKVRLSQGGRDVTQRVHTLVAKAFIPNPNGYDTVNHINGDKTDNRVENLEWADRKQQMYHAYQHRLKKPMQGTLNANAKLTDDDIRYIRQNYKRMSREFGTVALGKKFGVSNRVIGLIVAGKSYKKII